MYGVEKCLGCDGLNYLCNFYIARKIEVNSICPWYKIVDKDIEKLYKITKFEQNELELTFGELENILCEKNER